MVVAAVAGALDFWTFPFGSYAVTFESGGDSGLPLQFLACVGAGLVLAILAALRRDAGDLEWVALLVLAGGALLSTLWTPVLLVPAVAWILFGGWVWWRA